MISCLGIITKSRSATLDRCLNTYIHNLRTFGRKCRVVVVGNIEIAKIKENLKHNFQDGGSIWVIDHLEKRKFLNILLKQGIPIGISEFGLFGHKFEIDTGANRNCLLLHGCGEKFVSVDDDTLCNCMFPPHVNLELSFIHNRDPTSFWFPNNTIGFKGFNYNEKFDFLAEHDQVLGKKVTNLEQKINVTRKYSSQYDISQKLLKIDPEIRITLNGLYGDSGCEFPTFLLFLSEASLRNLLSTSNTYFNAKTNRQIFRASRSYSITDASVCMSTFIGMDGTALMPPFMPSLRAQDGLFGEVVWRCLKESYFCHLPFALKHQPPMIRSHDKDAVYRDAFSFRLNDILRFWVSAFAPPENMINDDEILRHLGRYFIEIASLPIEEFSALATTTIHMQLEKLMDQLKIVIELPLANKEFRHDQIRLAEVIEKRLTEKWFPKDIVYCFEGKIALEMSKLLIKKYGELLYWWPDIFELCKALKYKGVQIGRCITV